MSKKQPLTKLPPVNSPITITRLNKSPELTGPLKNACPLTIDIVGKLTEKPAWDKNPNNIAVVVPMSMVPLRIIGLDSIVAINGLPFKSIPINNDRQEFEIKGSTQRIYLVVREGNNWSCTCQGFKFHRACKHVEDKRGTT